MSDTILIEKFNNGDERAWQEIHDRFYHQLFNIIDNIIHNKERARELAYDCLIKIYEKKPRFEAIQQLQSFLKKSAKNNALNYLKSTARKMDNSFELTVEHETDENIEAVIDREFEHGSLIDKIIQEVKKHPKARREVFELFYFGKKTAEEIAAIKGIHPSKVYDYKKKLLKELEKKFGPDVNKLIYRQ